MVFGAEVLRASTSARASGCSVGSVSVVWRLAGEMFVVCVWLGWLFERWLGLVLWLVGMSLRPEAPFQISSWVTFCGCSLELTIVGANVGIQ
jgi:hypothetical protein